MKYCFIAPGQRVVHVLKGDTSSTGGAETQMAYIAASLARMGIEVDLIYGQGGLDNPTITVDGVQCIDAFPDWRNPRSLLVFFITLLRSRPTAFYANLPNDFLGIITLSSKLLRESIFIYALANDKHCIPWRTFDYHSWFHNPLYALGLRSADFITNQHEYQIDIVRPYVNGEIIYAPNLLRSIDSVTRDFDATTIDVIWVAFIRPVKHLELLLDAAEQLGNLQFAVVGGFDDITMDESTRIQFQSRMSLLENVTYYGAMDSQDILELLRHSKVQVNTSTWEGFPNTMLEAWSVGVPVISLSIDPGGVITREKIGLISTTFSQMLRDIQLLTDSLDTNCIMGEQGRKYVEENHSLAALAHTLNSITPGIEIENHYQSS